MAMARETAGERSDGGAAPVFEELVNRLDPSVLEVPAGSAVVRLVEPEGPDCCVRIDSSGATLTPTPRRPHPDAVLTAGTETWRSLASDIAGGMDAYRRGKLEVRGNLHVGVGFLAATARSSGAGRLRFRQVPTAAGTVSVLEAGRGSAVLMAHGLGATKASFLPTVAALAREHRCIAMDLPGFGDSDKPLFAPYDADFFADSMSALLDALEIRRADVVGHSMGGRAALQLALRTPKRVRRLVLLTPSLAWRRNRRWSSLLRFVPPELGVLQLAPRQVVERVLDQLLPEAASGWAAAGKDEFLRSYLTPAGRAAFYAAARQIYLERPDGDDGFWTRLGTLRTPSLWIWGRHDRLVPAGFRRHVAAALPAARQLTVDSGHVAQLERPREVHAAVASFLT
ncbi:MAG: alpha/beta fold hydrolase [Candidatus Dormibacteraeota bacterium]|nr:alpha/beta fold hydrolase [Candidatus Dormibacteraeota bacterium]